MFFAAELPGFKRCFTFFTISDALWKEGAPVRGKVPLGMVEKARQRGERACRNDVGGEWRDGFDSLVQDACGRARFTKNSSEECGFPGIAFDQCHRYVVAKDGNHNPRKSPSASKVCPGPVGFL